MSGPEVKPPSGACATPLVVAVPIILRVLLGGLFVFSGYMKLGGPVFTIGSLAIRPLDPLAFSFSIDKFKLGLPEQGVLLLAHIVPWTELVAGLAVVLGFKLRGAALVIALMMVGFIAGIASLLLRGIGDAKCTCFGPLGLFCGELPMGPCHIIRNSVFMAGALVLLWLGPGGLCIDRVGRRKSPDAGQ